MRATLVKEPKGPLPLQAPPPISNLSTSGSLSIRCATLAPLSCGYCKDPRGSYAGACPLGDTVEGGSCGRRSGVVSFGGSSMTRDVGYAGTAVAISWACLHAPRPRDLRALAEILPQILHYPGHPSAPGRPALDIQRTENPNHGFSLQPFQVPAVCPLYLVVFSTWGHPLEFTVAEHASRERCLRKHSAAEGSRR